MTCEYRHTFSHITSPGNLGNRINRSRSGTNLDRSVLSSWTHLTTQLNISISGTPRSSQLSISMKVFPWICINSVLLKKMLKFAQSNDTASAFNGPFVISHLSNSSKNCRQFSTAKWFCKNRSHLSLSEIILMKDAASVMSSILSLLRSMYPM